MNDDRIRMAPGERAEKLKCMAALARMSAAVRIAQGKPADLVRRESVAMAVEAAEGNLADEFDRETFVAVAQRAVEAELAGESDDDTDGSPSVSRLAG